MVYQLRFFIGDCCCLAWRFVCWLFKLGCVLSVMLSPYALDWVMDGCPSGEEAHERFVDEVKGGWR